MGQTRNPVRLAKMYHIWRTGVLLDELTEAREGKFLCLWVTRPRIAMA